MTLSGLDKLSRDDATGFAAQEVDPLDEELGTPLTASPASTSKAVDAAVQASADPLIDTTPFGVDTPSAAIAAAGGPDRDDAALFGLLRSEEHTSELQSLMRISYAVFCLKKKTNKTNNNATPHSSKIQSS